MNDPNRPIMPKQPDDSQHPLPISGPDEDQMIEETLEAAKACSRVLDREERERATNPEYIEGTPEYTARMKRLYLKAGATSLTLLNDEGNISTGSKELDKSINMERPSKSKTSSSSSDPPTTDDGKPE